MRPFSGLPAGPRSRWPKPVARACALGLLPWLASCGMVPLPERQGTDFQFINTAGPLQAAQVAYMDTNHLNYIDIPALPYQQVTFTATGAYSGQSPLLRVQFFALDHRPDCPVVASTRPGFGGALVCTGPAGGAFLGEQVFQRGQATSIVLSHAMMDQAVRGGVLYLGARLLEGQLLDNETVWITDIRVRARL